MSKSILTSLMLLAMLASASSSYAASSKDFASYYAAAISAEKQAGVLHHQWTTTEAVLKEAQAANAQKHEARAIALARKAEALAKASIKQAKQQNTLWRDAVIK